MENVKDTSKKVFRCICSAWFPLYTLSCERKVSIVVLKTIIVPICAIQDQHQALLASHGRDGEQRETPFISRKCEKDGTHGKGWCI